MAFSVEWNSIHKEREWGRYPNENLVRWVARNYYGTALRSAVRFLDLGCGSGSNFDYLSKEGFSVIGLDGSSFALARNQGANLVVADAVALPFEDQRFDCVIDILCTAHNKPEDMKRIFAEINRVLKPQGRIFSIMPTDATWRDPYMGKGNISFPTKNEVRGLFYPHFETEINWSAFSESNHVLEHWLISGTKHMVTGE